MKYAWIDEHRGTYSTTMMCELLSVSRSGLNAARGREPSQRSRQDEAVVEQILVGQRKHRGRYGRRRMTPEISQMRGQRVNEKRVGRWMREHGLQSHKRRRFRVVTKDSKHAHPVAPNVLRRAFQATAPNTEVADRHDLRAHRRRLAVRGAGAGPVCPQAGGLDDERDDGRRS